VLLGSTKVHDPHLSVSACFPAAPTVSMGDRGRYVSDRYDGWMRKPGGYYSYRCRNCGFIMATWRCTAVRLGYDADATSVVSVSTTALYSVSSSCRCRATKKDEYGTTNMTASTIRSISKNADSHVMRNVIMTMIVACISSVCRC
jgi:hypothetical protein